MSCKPQRREWKVTSTWFGSYPPPKDNVRGTKTEYDCLLSAALLSPTSAIVDLESRGRGRKVML